MGYTLKREDADMMRKIYLKIARKAIEEQLYNRELIDRDELLGDYPELAEPGATFVTLTLHGALRGCIGSLAPHRLLIDDIIDNARSAAFRDPRFMPLTLSELDEIVVEVSLLSAPQSFSYSSVADLKAKVRPGVDGVVLNLMGRRATFLPQVWEELPTFESFFSHLCQKAGLRGNCLEEHPQIELYRVEKIKEGDDE